MKFKKGDIVYWMGSDKAFGVVLGECKYYEGSYRLYANGSYDTHSNCSGKNLRHVTYFEKQLLLSALAKQNKYYCEQTKTIKEMQKEFTKKDLKSGMWVKLRNGDTMLCVGRAETHNHGTDICFIEDDGFIIMHNYNEDMECYEVPEMSIDSIFYDKITSNTFKFGSQPMIWQRDIKKDQVKSKIDEIQRIVDDMQEDIKQKLESINKLKQGLK